MDSIQQIIKDADYLVEGDNRNRAIRNINNVLSKSDVTIEIIKKGYHKTTKGGFDYNLKIVVGNLASRSRVSDMAPYTILSKLGKFLQREDVKDVIYSIITTPHTCYKCEGSGNIPQFDYYANGVCFDCMGIGTVGFLSVTNIQKMEEIERKKAIENNQRKEFKKTIDITELVLVPNIETEKAKIVSAIFNRINNNKVIEDLKIELSKNRNNKDKWGCWLNKVSIEITENESRIIQDEYENFARLNQGCNYNTYEVATFDSHSICCQFGFIDTNNKYFLSISFYRSGDVRELKRPTLKEVQHKETELKKSNVSSSSHIGESGEKYAFETKIIKLSGFSSNFGWVNIYTMEDNKGNIIVKFGTINNRYISNDDKDIDVDTTLSFTSVIKEHGKFRGIKQTTIGRLSKFNPKLKY